jgi:hypothetical protein
VSFILTRTNGTDKVHRDGRPSLVGDRKRLKETISFMVFTFHTTTTVIGTYIVSYKVGMTRLWKKMRDKVVGLLEAIMVCGVDIVVLSHYRYV